MSMVRCGAGRKCYPGMVRSGRSLGTPTTGLSLPGTSGNYLSVPDSNVTGDLAISFDGALTDWTPGANSVLVAKTSGTPQFSYQFSLNAVGMLRLTLSENGSTQAGTNSAGSPFATPGVLDGDPLAVGVTYRASDGRVQYWYANSGVTTAPGDTGWSILGTDRSIVVASIYAGTSPVTTGATAAGTLPLNGTVRRARIWASIDGTDERLDVNCVGQTKTATRAPSTFTEAAKSATVTVNGSAWDWVTT